MSDPPPDYFDAQDYSKPVRQIVVMDFLTKEMHAMTLYISPHRIDQFRVDVDGKPWKERIGWSRITAALRRSQPRFSQPH